MVVNPEIRQCHNCPAVLGMKFFQKIAVERIYRLFELAGSEFAKHPERSKRYVEIAKSLCTRNKVKIPQELRASFCKKCGSFLKEGFNSSVEKKGSLVILSCKECGFTRKMRATDNSCFSRES